VRRDNPHRLSRREALGALGGIVAAGSLDPSAWRAPRGAARRLDRIGVQLYTVRSEMQKSVERTLARVAELGYQEVEFAGYFNLPPTRIATLLTQNNLTSPSTHIDIRLMRSRLDSVLNDAEEVGHRYVTVPSIQASERTSEGYHRIADEFNRLGDALSKRGMTFAYHNHDFEFATVATMTGFDILIERTDPALVKFELDLFWIVKGGKDPAEYLSRHPGRFPIVHVKDMAADGSMVDVGAGRIDFPAIFAAAKGGIHHYFVEHDQPSDPFASIAASARHLRALR
jgi:sugar phosphate isomerase/epimerase